MKGKDFITQRILHSNLIINASMCVFRKENYYQVSGKHHSYKFIGDWLFWIEMAALGNVYISGKVLNYFRKHGGDVTSDAYKSGTYFVEYLQLAHHLHELKFLSVEKKQKLIANSFPKYYFSNLSNKSVRNSLTTTYRKYLGIKYYTILANTYFRKMSGQNVCTCP